MLMKHLAIFVLTVAAVQAQTTTPQPAPQAAAAAPQAVSVPGNISNAPVNKGNLGTSPWPRPTAQQAYEASKGKKVRIVLVGDSTMQPGSGYGASFCDLVTMDTACINEGKGGRSTKSYREEGSWKTILDYLGKLKPEERSKTWVLIQFGHNDISPKPDRHADAATDFPANMQRFVEELRAAGANPVLVTPLSQRDFKDGQVNNHLALYAEATRKVARDEAVPLLDLNADSVAYLNKVGKVEADTYAPEPAPSPKFDTTHLGHKGALVFGTMVEFELVTTIPELKPYFQIL
jgi:lysophospholipase L1-like esterase